MGVHVVDDVGPPVVTSVLELGGVLPDRDVLGVGVGGDLLLQGRFATWTVAGVPTPGEGVGGGFGGGGGPSRWSNSAAGAGWA